MPIQPANRTANQPEAQPTNQPAAPSNTAALLGLTITNQSPIGSMMVEPPAIPGDRPDFFIPIQFTTNPTAPQAGGTHARLHGQYDAATGRFVATRIELGSYDGTGQWQPSELGGVKPNQPIMTLNIPADSRTPQLTPQQIATLNQHIATGMQENLELIARAAAFVPGLPGQGQAARAVQGPPLPGQGARGLAEGLGAALARPAGAILSVPGSATAITAAGAALLPPVLAIPARALVVPQVAETEMRIHEQQLRELRQGLQQQMGPLQGPAMPQLQVPAAPAPNAPMLAAPAANSR